MTRFVTKSFMIKLLGRLRCYVLLDSIEHKLAEIQATLDDVEHKLAGKTLLGICVQCDDFVGYDEYLDAGFCVRLDRPVAPEWTCLTVMVFERLDKERRERRRL